MALVTEAKCLLDDKEELWEEKVIWMHRWEQKTGEVFPLVEHRQELGINTKIDAADGPTMAEADEAHERWVAKEIAHGRADKDVQMEEEVTQAVGEQGASLMAPAATEKMSHIKVVSQPVWKQSQQTVVESEDKDEPKIIIPPGLILHQETYSWHEVAWSGKAAKASSTKQAADDDDDEVKVVKSHMCMKGKAPVCSQLNAKVMANLSQSLRLLCAEAVESQVAYLCLQVHVNQLTKALEKIGVE
ncbi:hypothetical protein M404DRAFT_26539 [Pisolithus tinctorius Marx 270]|uniref:Uncharacterized protein n=1 Tax=Pisolithus tinctorius Marx 270 TaxID=870435 RepID=A0A0C3P8V6_PISTI|nr:hypothetical protein M404DRAFT_26539 [Pisolithus tinctorius Marx 270]